MSEHDTFPTAPDSTSTTNGTTIKDVQNTVVNNAAAAVNAVQNHPITQNLANGPAATSVKNQAAATGNELSGLANSRQQPSYTAANGETLTHYHSFFYSLLSWEHPRATGIAFASVIAFIFACRYLPILKYSFQMTYWALGLVSLVEVAGKLVLGTGFATSVRPRKYYKISKETMESSLDDIEQLVNFFVIEAQRILFAENVAVTGAACVTAFLGYYLIKILPFWGLSLLAASVIFLGPLIYISNKELIDGHLEHASNVVSAQASQVKDLASEHTGKAFESIKASTSDYTDKASSLIGQSRQKIPTMEQAKASVTGNTTGIKGESFPTAPKTDLPSTSPAAAETTLPTVNAPTESNPVAASY